MKSRLKLAKQFVKPLSKAIKDVDGKRLLLEVLKLDYDLKKYSSGVLLWANDEYPNCMLIFSALFGNLFKNRTSKFQPNMKRTVEDYFKFIEDVNNKNPKDYHDEFNVSKLVLSKQPLQMLVSQDKYLKKFYKELLEGLDIYSSQVKDYTVKTIPVLITFTRDIKRFLLQNSNIELNEKYFDFDLEKIETIKDLEQQIKTIPKTEVLKFVFKLLKKAKNEIRKIQKESLSSIPEVDESFKRLIEALMKDIDEVSWVEIRLKQIEKIDAFIIHFNKYIARLFYILSRNSKDYYPVYIRLNQKSEPRSELISILDEDMREKYPHLSQYLYSMLYYFRDLRHFEAHNDPIVKIYDGVVYVVRPESGEKVEINIPEIVQEIYTYSHFIEALGLPKAK